MSEPRETAPVQYGYFAVQAKVTLARDGVLVTGVLENLGTGEKHPFAGRDGLAALIDNWSRGIAVGVPDRRGGEGGIR